MAKRTPLQQKQFEAAEAYNREQYGDEALPEDQVNSTNDNEPSESKLDVQSGKLGQKAQVKGGKE